MRNLSFSTIFIHKSLWFSLFTKLISKFKQRLTNNEFADFACLDSKANKLREGQKCYTAGWGTLSSGGNAPARLQEVNFI